MQARAAQVVDLDAPVPMTPSAAAGGAEIERQVATAKMYPRSIERFRKTVTALATLNEEVASQCLYAMPRGGKVIEGPSIRFAEIVVASWGNCRVASQVVGEDGSFVKAQGLFWDLETNAAIGFEVRRPIVYSKTHKIERLRGQRFDDDMIGVTGNAASAIARRNATLGGIPKALWWDLYLQAKAAAVGDVQTLASRRAKAIEAFKRFGVTEAQIFATLGVAGINEIDLDGLAKLRGFLTAIQQEEKDPSEIFAAAETKDARPERQAPPDTKTDAKIDTAVDTAAPTDAPKDGEDPLSADEQALESAIANALLDAKTPGDVDGIAALFEIDVSHTGPTMQARFTAMLAEARVKFSNGNQ